MPITPLHMGPGLLIKSVFRGAFSLTVFGWSQILMDLQPLVVLITGEGRLHGITHTWLGAAVIGAVAAATGKPLASLGLRVIRLERYLPIRWPTAVATAFVGTFSHVLLDSFIYDDMTPLQPFSNASPLLDMASMDAVLAFCVIAGGVGAAAWFLVSGRRGASG